MKQGWKLFNKNWKRDSEEEITNDQNNSDALNKTKNVAEAARSTSNSQNSQQSIFEARFRECDAVIKMAVDKNEQEYPMADEDSKVDSEIEFSAE